MNPVDCYCGVVFTYNGEPWAGIIPDVFIHYDDFADVVERLRERQKITRDHNAVSDDKLDESFFVILDGVTLGHAHVEELRSIGATVVAGTPEQYAGVRLCNGIFWKYAKMIARAKPQ